MTYNDTPNSPASIVDMIVNNRKTSRKRRPWVLKVDYDRLQRKYNILAWIAALGWLAFIVTLKFAI